MTVKLFLEASDQLSILPSNNTVTNVLTLLYVLNHKDLYHENKDQNKYRKNKMKHNKEKERNKSKERKGKEKKKEKKKFRLLSRRWFGA